MKKIKRKTGLIALSVLLSQSMFASTLFADSEEVTIGDKLINVREGAGLDYPIIAKVEEGDRFKVLSREGEWIKIQVSDEKEGWVAEWLVTPKKDISKTSGTAPSLGYTTADGLRIRKGPGTDYPVVSILQNNTQVEIIGQSGSWVEFETSSGRGFISQEYIRTGSQSLSFGRITADSVHLRSAPSLSADILGKIKKGSSAEIIKEENGWTNIQYQGKSYWISSQYITKKGSSTSAEQLNVEITASSLNVRSSAKIGSTVIGTVKKGNTYEVVSQNDRWYQIKLEDGQKGWIAAWYARPSDKQASKKLNMERDERVTITQDSINIRTGPGTNHPIAKVAAKGDSYKFIGMKKDWALVQMPDGSTGYIASWLLTPKDSPVEPASNGNGSLAGKLIVLDAGHGGTDSGAIGTSGHFEKQLTLRTALLLSTKLKQEGASVLLTRNGDQYITLSDRALLSNQQAADAFISIHYDSTADMGAGGITTYYTQDQQQELALHIQRNLVKNTSPKDRGVRQASLRVLRENKQPAVLVELGYISNPSEESLLHTSHYQERVTDGLLNGLKSFLSS
ncbi:SH3 domain-containing protein [Pradoshia sp.]